MRKPVIIVVLVVASCLRLRAQIPQFNPERIEVYVTPFYASEGPSVDVGAFSKGLASKNEDLVLATIEEMRKHWDHLTFAQLYVASIRLYDLGYRDESVYWYYSAQYRGRQFTILLDRSKIGGFGSAGFDLAQANGAFFELVGPYISGYAYSDIPSLCKTIRRVRSDEESILDLAKIYPEVVFRDQSEWQAANRSLGDGMEKLAKTIAEKEKEIKQKRAQMGLDVKFARLARKTLANQSSDPILSSGTSPAGQETRHP